MKPLPVGLPPLEQVASFPGFPHYFASMYCEPKTGRPGNKQVCMYGVGRSSSASSCHQVVSLKPSNHLQSLPVHAGVPGFLSPIAAPCGPCSLEVYLLQAMAGAHASVLGQATQDLGVHSATRYDGLYPLPPTPKLHIYFLK